MKDTLKTNDQVNPDAASGVDCENGKSAARVERIVRPLLWESRRYSEELGSAFELIVKIHNEAKNQTDRNGICKAVLGDIVDLHLSACHSIQENMAVNQFV